MVATHGSPLRDDRSKEQRENAVTTELSDLELFQELKGPDLEKLRRRAEEVRFKADDIVFQEGDDADAFYLVLEGKVSIYRGQVGRPTERLAALSPGEFFGEMGLLAEASRNASARAETDAVLLKLTKDYLLELLRHHPAIELKLRNTIIRRRNANIAGALDLGRRDDVRIRVNQPVVLRLPDGGRLDTILENLSAGGACLRGVPVDWRVGKHLRFDLGRNGDDPLLSLQVRVAWRRRDAVGISFRSPPKDHLENVRNALMSLLA
jgi:CRP-like cAMP-binding protein